ncbi:G patch domain-containing protein 4 [Melanotaenia boesemani]|uniref:G patch domain-containing protein 4 n=1 Tax=Melanotaenia boesemani TaxID=1250792 RepID=UPI001C0478E6|nr:G patch domain-containing protein 4 [Melanotaenia boesemani]
MAEAVQEKSRGLKFAEQQLLRHGWEHGKGLGRAENGISEAIKVKVKCDKGGVGHKEGEQFTFHWWDHVFNKASSSLQVESDQRGIKLKKSAEEDEEDGRISNKKPRKASQAKAKLYGCFVKSATLLSGQEQPEPKSTDSDDSSSSDEDEEEQKLDLSSTTKLSDADLMKVCGGRTAHKGARHGLTMSAKLARLEQQEAEFMAKYGKKSQPESSSQSEQQEETTDSCRRRKVKKEKPTETSEPMREDVQPKKKRKKNKKGDSVEEGSEPACGAENGEEDHRPKRKHEKMAEQNGDGTPPSPAAEKPHEPRSDSKTKKQKKKSSKQEAGQSDQTSQQDADVSTSTEKKKRKKSNKERSVDGEPLPPKKKKKKSKD